jgi:hypothetical protein
VAEPDRNQRPKLPVLSAISADVDFFNGDGLIEVDYAYKPGGWIVSGYKKPPDSVVN